ncbi:MULTISPECIES: DUF1127 domain-containing protein [unclassified Sinorhizobium]|uniref:DUF1127 domain-containing protein n=1 Tax=unclassified Sinorhizobium TaxID=2613772 RepID=UPI003523BEBF
MSRSIDTIETISAAVADSSSERTNGLLNSFRLWAQKRKGRRALRELTDDQLKDIGLTRAEAMKEVSKSYFWD